MPEVVESKIKEFFSKYAPRSHDKGHILIMHGEAPEYTFLLEQGNIKVYDVSKQGDEVVLNIFKPGAFFPMSIAINKTDNPYIYEADTNIIVRRAPILDSVEFLRDNPDVMFDLLARVYRGTDALLGRIAHLMGGSAQSRLIYELLQEVRRFGKQNNKGIGLEITETELGTRCGLSRETISRELRKLKDKKLVKVEPNKITLLDIDSLEDVLKAKL